MITDRFLRRQEVENLTGYTRSSIYRLIGEGDFPQPIKLTPRTARWRESDVVAWQQRKVQASFAP